MKLIDTCIHRPVLATVISLILIALGIMGYQRLATRFFPKFEQPTLTVTTQYPGASAKLIETNITTPLEDAISGISGIDTIESNSSTGVSQITVTLKSNADKNELANQIRNQVAAAQTNLPQDSQAPIVRTGRDSWELMDIVATDSSQSLVSIRDYIDRYLTNSIQEISGVADVTVGGSGQYVMKISLDPKKLAFFRLTTQDISTAIQQSNLSLPVGQIQADQLYYPITADTKLTSAEAFGNIILANRNNHLIRLSDVATVALSTPDTQQMIVHINGKRGVLIQVYNTNEANPIDVAAHVKALLKNVNSQLPPGMTLTTVYDQSLYMKASVHEVYIAIGLSVLCVCAVILLFLGDLRASLIPIVTIPICLIATFGLMALLGFTINVITLLAVVLSIGLVVDDAIVMLENIYRYIEEGMSPLKAAIKGANEIKFAIIAMTLTLAAVYAPVGLVQGDFSQIVRSFAFTLAGAVIISGFVALTLSPMMSAKGLRALPPESSTQPQVRGFFRRISLRQYQRQLSYFFDGMSRQYQRGLSHVLNRRWLVVVLFLGIATSGFFLAKSLGFDFMPKEDMGFLVTVMPPSSGVSSQALSQQMMTDVMPILQKNSNIENSLAIASTNDVNNFNIIFSLLKPYQQRHQSAQVIANTINAQLGKIPGIRAHSFPPSFGGSMQHQLAFNLMGGRNEQNLYQVSQSLIQRLKDIPGLTNVNASMNFNSQQYVLHVNRNLLGYLNLNVAQVDQTLATLWGGSTVSTFDLANKAYDVWLQAQPSYLRNIKAINDFYVRSSGNQMVPLSSVVTAKSILTQPEYTHYNRFLSTTISAQLKPGYNLGQVVQTLQAELPQLLPTNIKYAFIGAAKQMLSSNSHMGTLFILALVFIYLVLSAQFESFLDPLIILLVVPLTVVGALLGLKLFQGTFNIYTTVGLVTLIGLIAKHGILMTTFANTLRDEGVAVAEAIKRAAAIRLRPILMTTAATVFGALPLVLAAGASANSRRQIGLVIIFGMVLGTFFSLVVVPVAYSLMASVRGWVARRFSR